MYVLREARPGAVIVWAWLQVIGKVNEPGIACVRGVEGAHRNKVHDVPADLHARVDDFCRSVDEPIHLLLAGVPKAFPGKDLRVFKEDTPEADEASVRNARAA